MILASVRTPKMPSSTNIGKDEYLVETIFKASWIANTSLPVAPKRIAKPGYTGILSLGFVTLIILKNNYKKVSIK